jgi:F0F1-type ATP synthase alpha subunit
MIVKTIKAFCIKSLHFFIFKKVSLIVLRDFVRDAFLTGIFAIDTAVPIGRG